MAASELLCSVRARAPSGRPDLLGGHQHAEVGGGEGVGVAQAAHGDDLGSPRSDAGQCQQLPAGAIPVAAGVQEDVAVGQRPDERDQDRCRDFGKAR